MAKKNLKKKSIKAIDITFIIPRRVSESSAENIERVHKYAKELNLHYEVIVSNGNSATVQRNKSAEKSSCEYLYFLDNDSLLNRDTLKILCSFILEKNNENEEVDIVGGPSLLFLPATLLQKSIDTVLGCPWIVGEVASRYNSLGNVRNCDEKSLILCNMVVRRVVFFEMKKFYEMLYPAEEVDFIMRANRMRKKVYYHPQIAVSRPQRATYAKFFYQMFNYGVGRSEMTKLVPLNFNWFFLFPSIGLIFIVALIGVTAFFSIKIVVVAVVVLFLIYSLYLFFALMTTLKTLRRKKLVVFFFPFIAASCHAAYTVGIIFGFFKKSFAADRRIDKIEVDKIF